MALSERRKADREELARRVEALARPFGAEVEVTREAREVNVLIRHGGAQVNIEFDGGPFNSQPDVYCMPWNVDTDRELRFSPAFGCAVGAEVNPFHRLKCMGFAEGIVALEARLGAALDCINRGEAFLEDQGNG